MTEFEMFQIEKNACLDRIFKRHEELRKEIEECNCRIQENFRESERLHEENEQAMSEIMDMLNSI